MNYLLFFYFFALGAVIGSFLNVVALRYNTGRTVAGRSSCFSCGKKLKWWELLPIVSFVFLRGKCSVCGSKISWQYPLVEFLTAVIFTGVYVKYSPLLFSGAIISFLFSLFFFLFVFSILIVIFVYDIHHKIIPNGLVYGFSILALGSPFLKSYLSLGYIDVSFLVFHAVAGVSLFFFFALMWLVSKGAWMGFGDAKLALGIGFLLGVVEGVSAIILAFWVGAITGILILLWNKVRTYWGKGRLSQDAAGLTMKSEIPFAPFLIIGLWLVYFFHLDVLGIGRIMELTT